MAILNQVATQIAVKRLSGKAQVSALLSLSQEAKASTVQTLSSTVFGELVPNTPTTESADLYVVQSSSLSDPGTVMLAEFAVYPLAGTSKYQNVINGGVGTGVDELDTGENSIDTYHAYALYISGGAAGFEASATTNGFDTYASTTTALGTGQFQDGFYLTGSGKLQIVPEFASVDNFTAAYPYNNKYTPIIRSTDGSIIQPNSGIDWYLDPYAGILFIQDPEDYGTNYNTTTGASQNSGPEIPSKITAFLYVGKYQDEVTFTSGDVNFKVSGSNDGFDVGNGDTINFISGSAGITVRQTGVDADREITIGDATNNVTFNQITASIINADTIEVSEFIVSSSVSYFTQSFSSGSTIFGDTNDDTHQFTGSIQVIHTGSEVGTKTGGIILTGSGLWIEHETSISASGIISASDLHLTDTFTALDGGVTIESSGAPELNVAGNITASGDISSSGMLFASLSLDTAPDSDAVVAYDIATGKFFYTGSYGAADTSELEASASAGIYFSGSTGGGESIELMQTASFIGGTGTTVTYAAAGNTLTFDNTTPLYIGTASGDGLSVSGSSITYAGTSSFTSSGAGLSVDYNDSGRITYTLTPQDVFDAFATANTGSFTASYANTASFVITASHALTASKINVLHQQANNFYPITFAELPGTGSIQLYSETGSGGTGNNSGFGLTYNPNAAQVSIGGAAPSLTLTSSINAPSSVAPSTTYGLNAIITSGSSYNITTTQGPVGNTDTTLNIGLQTHVINIGAPPNYSGSKVAFNNDVTIAGSASIEGDLIVRGAVTSVETDNLNVTDQFILLNSGSTTTEDGGIIIARNGGGSGPALFLDSDVSRFAVAKGVAWDNTTAITQATNGTMEYLVSVSSSNVDPTTTIEWGDGATSYGQMFVNSNTGEIFIYG